MGASGYKRRWQFPNEVRVMARQRRADRRSMRAANMREEVAE